MSNSTLVHLYPKSIPVIVQKLPGITGKGIHTRFTKETTSHTELYMEQCTVEIHTKKITCTEINTPS